MAGARQRTIYFEFDRGPKGLDAWMRTIELNLGATMLHKAVFKGWTGIGREYKHNFRSIVPRRKKPYPHSHPNQTRQSPRRRPGELRRRIRYRSTRPSATNVPRAYLSTHQFPWHILVKGDAHGRFGPQVPGIDWFYDHFSPRMHSEAIDIMLAQKNISDPMRRR